jgi:wyosine [tRNA(Phe)-imidazoG37] synthetase (radical SAM superfamily)
MTPQSQRHEFNGRHSGRWRGNKYVYPVISPRSHGLSIVVNLNPDGVCNFDCIYCDVDPASGTNAGPVNLEVLRTELDELLSFAATREIFREAPFDRAPAELRRFSDVAFSGDGEPTACDRFRDVGEIVAELLASHKMPEAKIAVVTNATLLRRAAVKEALGFLDQHHGEVWAKLDAGTRENHGRVARSTISLANILANILDAARIRPIVIQSMFLKIHDMRPSEHELAAYVHQLQELVAHGAQIKLVQIYTSAHPPAEKYVAPLEAHVINQIVRRVRQIGLNAEGFYGVD